MPLTPNQFRFAKKRFDELAKTLNELCVTHSLGRWTLVIDGAPRRRLGQCRYMDRELGISLSHLLQHDDRDVLDTLLHEVAHAYAGQYFKCYDHGRDFYRACRIVGAREQRCQAPGEHGKDLS